MDTQVRARAVASATHDVSALANSARCQEDRRTDGIARAPGASNQFEGNPVIAVFHHVTQQRRNGIHIIEDNIDVAIIEEVSERSASGGHDEGQAASGCRRHLLELSAIQIAEKLRAVGPGSAPITLINCRIYVAISDEYITEAIVVEIEETSTPS